MTDEHRDALRALGHLAEITDANVLQYPEGSSIRHALDRWLLDDHHPGCAHVRLGGLMLGRLNSDLLLCHFCAGKYWINDDYLSKVTMCDACDRPMEMPGDVNISTIGPFLIVGVLCVDCQPTEVKENNNA